MPATPSSRPSIVCVATFLAALALAPHARAQVHASTWTPVQESPGITLVLGRLSAGNAGVTDRPRTRAFSLRVDKPAGDDLLLRLEVGRAAWPFARTQYADSGSPCCPSGATPSPIGTIADRVAVTRITAGIVRRHLPVSAGGWTPLYAGGGVGLYRFRSRTGVHYPRPWRTGLHGFAGFEAPIPDRRLAITGEVQFHLSDAPPQSALTPSGFITTSVSFGLKFRL